jgi:hypothetical protein
MSNANSTHSPASLLGSVDDHLIQTMRQEQLTRRLWTYASVVILIGVAVFIALQ